MTADSRKPLILHCLDCRHSWAPCFLPATVDETVKALSQLSCPMCRSSRHALGASPKPTPIGDATAWFRYGDTGLSSLVIYHVLHGVVPDPERATPRDPSDFGRCVRLLQVMPAWRARLPEVAARYPEWRGLVQAWDELEALYVEELPTGTCPRLFARLQALRGTSGIDR